MSSKAQMLTELLKDLSKASQGNVQASLIINRSEGLVICSDIPANVSKDTLPDDDTIAGRSTQIEMAVRNVFSQLKRGEFVRMLIEGETGYVIISSAGSKALLVILTNKRVNLGFIFFMMTRVAQRIDSIL